jgi:outer membrane protein TolC
MIVTRPHRLFSLAITSPHRLYSSTITSPHRLFSSAITLHPLPIVLVALIAAVAATPTRVDAQVPTPSTGPANQLVLPTPTLPDTNPFLGGVPRGEATAQPLTLTLKDAIDRGLQNNLGVLLQEDSVTAARGARWQALSDLLPNVSARVGEARRQTSLAEFGFTQFPGIESTVIGPFNVFDARIRASQPLIDMSAIYGARAGSANLRAARAEVHDARDLVVLVVANLYLNTVATTSRVEAVRSELETANTVFNITSDMKQSGIAVGIDVLRAQLQQQTERQRLIASQNELAKAKLQLGRAIGLPSGQDVTLVDQIPYAPLDGVTIETALQQAYASRGDYLAAAAQLDAAEATRKAAKASLLPSLHLDTEVGRVGTSTSTTDLTYGIAASVIIPVFESGRAQGRLLQSQAQLNERKSQLADLRARIDVEVRSALLDVQAAAEALQAAKLGVDLATQQLTQSRDRFSAGVAGSLEVQQSQEALARANDVYISTLYAHNLAKATLARAAGVAEDRVKQFLGGVR